ncbi:MAG: hypothetical protein ACREOQ_11885 [Gemmatimonadales bacterium]
MRRFVPGPLTIAASLALAGTACASDADAPRADSPQSDGSILTTFDRLTLAPGDRAGFHAAFVGATGRLGSAGLTFASRAPSVARVSAADGRVAVQGIAAGRTWVVVRSVAATDSVEVVVQ